MGCDVDGWLSGHVRTPGPASALKRTTQGTMGLVRMENLLGYWCVITSSIRSTAEGDSALMKSLQLHLAALARVQTLQQPLESFLAMRLR
jgi:hypothetical protein